MKKNKKINTSKKKQNKGKIPSIATRKKQESVENKTPVFSFKNA